MKVNPLKNAGFFRVKLRAARQKNPCQALALAVYVPAPSPSLPPALMIDEEQNKHWMDRWMMPYKNTTELGQLC